MVDYASLSATAKRLIEENGREFFITESIQEQFDPATNSLTDSFKSKACVIGLVTSFSKSQIDGQTIQQGDRKILISAESIDFEIETSHRIEEKDCVWNIIDVDVIQPGAPVLIYSVHVRR